MSYCIVLSYCITVLAAFFSITHASVL